MQTIFRLVGRADVFLARLNAGLVVVAITFTVVTVWAARHPDIFQVEYDAAAASVGIAPVDSTASPVSAGEEGVSAKEVALCGIRVAQSRRQHCSSRSMNDSPRGSTPPI